jgi:hypothetical protein
MVPIASFTDLLEVPPTSGVRCLLNAHSVRNATIGSTCAARRAGTQHATDATATRVG